jgi:hypothetical protein
MEEATWVGDETCPGWVEDKRSDDENSNNLPNNFALDSSHVTNWMPAVLDSCIIVLSFGMFKYILKTIRTYMYVDEDERQKRCHVVGSGFTFDRHALMKQLLAHERACTAAQKRGQVHHLFKDRTEEGDGDRVPICEKMCKELKWNDLLLECKPTTTCTGALPGTRHR